MPEETYCHACGEPIAQLPGGHRKREYCNDLCRQQAFRLRAVQQGKERYKLRLLSLEQRLQHYTAETQQRVLFTLDHYGLDAAELQADSIDHEKGTTASIVTESLCHV